MAGRADRPSPGVLLVSGFGVLLVVAFVIATAVGTTPERSPGDLLAVARSAGPAGTTIFAGRCTAQRVTRLRVLDPAGATLWEIRSALGSIERRYVLGAEPAPLGFETVTPLRGVPAGQVQAELTLAEGGRDDVVDVLSFDPGDVAGKAPDLGDAAPPCSHGDGSGAISTLFAVGAAAVVGGFLAMLTRRRRAR